MKNLLKQYSTKYKKYIINKLWGENKEFYEKIFDIVITDDYINKRFFEGKFGKLFEELISLYKKKDGIIGKYIKANNVKEKMIFETTFLFFMHIIAKNFLTIFEGGKVNKITLLKQGYYIRNFDCFFLKYGKGEKLFYSKVSSIVYLGLIKLLKEKSKYLREIKDIFVCLNLLYIYKKAKKYSASQNIDSIIMNGILGLEKALEKFDLNKHIQQIKNGKYKELPAISSYIIYRIDNYIINNIFSERSIVELPAHIINDARRYSNIESIKKGELKNNFTKDMINSIERINNKVFFNYISIGTAQKKDGEDYNTEELISDKDVERPEYELKIIRDYLKKILSYLDEREKEIIIKRFGLFGEERKKLDEISKEIGITKERVRQIEGKALKKLKHNMTHDGFCNLSKYIDVSTLI